MYTPRNLRHKRPSTITRLDDNKKSMTVFFIVSLLVHVIVVGAMIFFQDFTFPKPLPPVIQVDLVSFAPDPVFEESQSRSETNKDGVSITSGKTKSRPRKIKHIKADVSLKTKPKNIKELLAKQQEKKKKPLKKKPEKPPKKPPEKPPEKAPEKEPEKVVDTQKELEKARQELAKKIEAQNQSKINQALSRLRKTVSDTGGPQSPSSKSGRARAGQNSLKPLDIYHYQIQFAIKENWVYTDIFANMDQNLEVILLVKILASGEIRDIIYETRSGNRYLDESAKKAIIKSNPLPPLPSGMPYYDFGLKFTPKGLK